MLIMSQSSACNCGIPAHPIGTPQHKNFIQDIVIQDPACTNASNVVYCVV